MVVKGRKQKLFRFEESWLHKKKYAQIINQAYKGSEVMHKEPIGSEIELIQLL